jgi:Ca2+-binding EF-hand superfamily protein
MFCCCGSVDIINILSSKETKLLIEFYENNRRDYFSKMGITMEDIIHLYPYFKKIDIDNSGYIVISELLLYVSAH